MASTMTVVRMRFLLIGSWDQARFTVNDPPVLVNGPGPLD
jgi:hypothetical protein